MSQRLVIGITGNIACGKSAVVTILRDLGAEAIDADAVYHSLIGKGSRLWQRITERFGSGVLSPTGEIDRIALGRTVFRDAAALQELEQLTHAEVVDEILRRLASMTAAVIAIDAVKLIESGLADACDEVWLVMCEREQQIERLIARNHLSLDDAMARVAAQSPLKEKLALADVVIENSGTIATTRRQVEREWRRLMEAGRGVTAIATDRSSTLGNRSN